MIPIRIVRARTEPCGVTVRSGSVRMFMRGNPLLDLREVTLTDGRTLKLSLPRFQMVARGFLSRAKKEPA